MTTLDAGSSEDARDDDHHADVDRPPEKSGRRRRGPMPASSRRQEKLRRLATRPLTPRAHLATLARSRRDRAVRRSPRSRPERSPSKHPTNGRRRARRLYFFPRTRRRCFTVLVVGGRAAICAERSATRSARRASVASRSSDHSASARRPFESPPLVPGSAAFSPELATIRVVSRVAASDSSPSAPTKVQSKPG